jgi:2-polyprenyl-6-methoxyphenol hydroxylase-like FAD-dependent oxidoreductase
VLLGDAAAPFPPIGQGVNAAMESAVVLDGFIGEPDVDPRDAAARYSAVWKPESDAVTWISERVLFDNPLNTAFDSHHGPWRKRRGPGRERDRAVLRSPREGPTARAAVGLSEQPVRVPLTFHWR